jgi:hypothetical protein
MPNGLVQFWDNSVSPARLVGQAGVINCYATLKTSTLAAGSHNITATYVGNANFLAVGPSNAVTPTVLQAATSTSGVTITEAATDSPVSSITYGDPVVLTATVANTSGTPAMPTGLVRFYNTSVSPPQLIGQAGMVGGVATLPANPATSLWLVAGSYTITATYVGTVNFMTSGSATASDLSVAAAPTSVSLNSSVSGNQVTFSGGGSDTAVYPSGVTSPPMSGVVQVFDGSKLIAAVAVAKDGTWTTAALTLASGPHSITVHYVPPRNVLGLQNFVPSSNSESITV